MWCFFENLISSYEWSFYWGHSISNTAQISVILTNCFSFIITLLGIRDKKVLKKRTDEDNKLKIAKEKKKMKRDRKKNGKEGPPGCHIL